MHTPTDDETPLLIDILKALARDQFALRQDIYGPIEERERLENEIEDELNPHVSADSDTTTESPAFHAVESLSEISPETLTKMQRIAELQDYEISEADDEALHAHPLCWLCERLEPLLGGRLNRFELEWAAHRLNTAIGWNSWKRQTPVDGEVQMEWPDIRWLGEKLLALDRDGVTARLWRELQGQFRDTLIEAGLLEGKRRSKKRRPKKAGRRMDTDAREDKRISDAWKSSGYRTHEELATHWGISPTEVKHALDRHRKRRG